MSSYCNGYSGSSSSSDSGIGGNTHEVQESQESQESQEPPNEYAEYNLDGGYCRIEFGVVLYKRYTVIKKKGWGHFSTAWIVLDNKTGKIHIMKVVKSTKDCTQSAIDEVIILNNVKGLPHIVQIVDSFSIPDSFNKKLYHICIVMEDHGTNLLKLIDDTRNGKTMPLAIVKQIGCQLLNALKALETINLIHADIKPENVVFKFDGDGKIIVTLIDLGNAFKPSDGIGGDCEIATREYRSFENLVGNPVDKKSDIWSLVCLLFELATGEYLFEPDDKFFSKDEDHIALIIELLLKEEEILDNKLVCMGSKYLDYFVSDDEGNIELQNIKELTHRSLKNVLIHTYNWEVELASKFSALLLPMLELDPKIRISAIDAFLQWSS